jgi:hypothetical protein
MKQLTKLEKIIGAGIIALSLATGYVAREGQVQSLRQENARVNVKYEEALQNHRDFVYQLPNGAPNPIGESLTEKKLLADIQHYYHLGIEYSLSK